MCPLLFSGIVTVDALVSCWPIFSLSLVTVREVFANAHSCFLQFPSRFKWRMMLKMSSLLVVEKNGNAVKSYLEFF